MASSEHKRVPPIPGPPNQAVSPPASLPLPVAAADLASPLTTTPQRCKCGIVLGNRSFCKTCKVKRIPRNYKTPQQVRKANRDAKTHLPPNIRLADDSPIREKALKIVAMEAAGVPREEVAKALGIAVGTLKGYLYKAGANGWLEFSEPRNKLEYQILHKVVRNLDQALDSEDMELRTNVALKTAEGTLFKHYDAPQGQAAQTMIGVRIEVVGGPQTPMREGTTGGTPAYVEGETE